MNALSGAGIRLFVLGALLAIGTQAQAQTDPLPSWNDGAAKQAIVKFVQATTTQGNPQFVPRPSASPPSTRTARSGSSIRCIPR